MFFFGQTRESAPTFLHFYFFHGWPPIVAWLCVICLISVICGERSERCKIRETKTSFQGFFRHALDSAKTTFDRKNALQSKTFDRKMKLFDSTLATFRLKTPFSIESFTLAHRKFMEIYKEKWIDPSKVYPHKTGSNRKILASFRPFISFFRVFRCYLLSTRIPLFTFQ